jgi:alpha-glucosidase
MEEVPVHRLPLYVKESAIIPIQSLVQSTKEQPGDTLFLHIYNGTVPNSFVYYEDAGDGFGYQNEAYCKRTIQFLPNEKKLIIGKQDGRFRSRFQQIQLVLHGFENLNAVVHKNTKHVLTPTNQYKLFNPLAALKTVYEKGYFASLAAMEKAAVHKTVVIENETEELMIAW